jgi:sugar transferase (PEP-CTERM/EpsH1 system associated)
MSADARPLVVHVIHRLDIGGLENGLVNLINFLPEAKYRHAVICLTTASTFAARIRRPDVEIVELRKRPGKDFTAYARLYSHLRRLRPAIVHTRNVGTVDCQAIAWAARVRGRIHGEQGWDIGDLHGRSPRYRLLRRLARPFVRTYITVSRDLADWLATEIGVPARRIRQIYSGVDLARFRPREAAAVPPWPPGFLPAGGVVIGTVGRMERVKNTVGLVRAFARLLDAVPSCRDRARLVLVGAGEQRNAVEAAVAAANLGDLVWMPGARDDVAALLPHFDVFALPSLNEGVSNTILEAMACAVPVVASRVGGTPEVVRHGETGLLYEAEDDAAAAAALAEYVRSPALRSAHGRRARELVVERHSIESMMRGYEAAYDQAMAER